MFKYPYRSCPVTAEMAKAVLKQQKSTEKYLALTSRAMGFIDAGYTDAGINDNIGGKNSRIGHFPGLDIPAVCDHIAEEITNLVIAECTAEVGGLLDTYVEGLLEQELMG
jgi:hypothetical protein